MRSFGWTLLVTTAFLVPAVARADAPADDLVVDQARLFFPVTREKLAEEIRDIRRLYHREVCVETLESLSPEEKQRFKGMRAREQATYLAELGRQHSQTAEVDGIHILICRDPKRVVVTVWPESQQQAFTDTDAERVRKLIAHRLFLGRFAGGPDRAILDAVERVKSILHTNLQRDNPEAGVASGAVLGGIILVALVAWAALRLASSRLTDSPLAAPSDPGTMAGTLGGMFGSPAGLRIYDRLYAPPPSGAANDGSLSPTNLGIGSTPPSVAASSAESSWPSLSGQGSNGANA